MKSSHIGEHLVRPHKNKDYCNLLWWSCCLLLIGATLLLSGIGYRGYFNFYVELSHEFSARENELKLN